jgi:hypothetical protein
MVRVCQALDETESNTEELPQSLSKLHNEGFHCFYSSANIISAAYSRR